LALCHGVTKMAKEVSNIEVLANMLIGFRDRFPTFDGGNEIDEFIDIATEEEEKSDDDDGPNVENMSNDLAGLKTSLEDSLSEIKEIEAFIKKNF
jgi:hypothetical protein